MFVHQFMINAVIAGVLISVMLSVLGFFVVLRKMSFIGVGIAHSAFGGVAIGYYLGVPLLVSTSALSLTNSLEFTARMNPIVFASALIFSFISAMAIGAVSRKGKLRSDVTIGIFFAVGMAVGILFLSLARGYPVDPMSYLFGSIIAVTKWDIWISTTVAAIIVTVIFLFFKELLACSFNSQLARASGIPESFLSYLLLGLISVGIVTSIKVVGIVLVSALLILPTATALQYSRRYRIVLILSILFGLTYTMGGLIITYWIDAPPGATIVILGTVFFILSLLISPVRISRRKHSTNIK